MILFTGNKCPVCSDFFHVLSTAAEQIREIEKSTGNDGIKMEFYTLDLSKNDIEISDITNKTSITAPSTLLFVNGSFRAEYHGGSFNPQIVTKWILENVSKKGSGVSPSREVKNPNKKRYQDVSSPEFK